MYEVQYLITNKREVIHARRLYLYRADMDGQDVHSELLKVADHSEANYQIIQALRDIREVDGELQIYIEWKGLPDEVDWNWEGLLRVREDVSGRLNDFLQTSGARDLKHRALAQCSFI